MKLIRFLPILVLLTACAPAAQSQAPAIPVSTSAASLNPTATETRVPTSTATPTESPTATIMPTEKGPPPEDFTDWAEARKYGWVENAEGNPEQHIVKNAEGDIILGDLVIQLVEIRYDDDRYNYQFPQKGGKQLFPSLNLTSTFYMLAPTAHCMTLSYLVKNPEVLNNPPFTASGKDETRFELWTDQYSVPYTWKAGDQEPNMPFGLFTSADGENPEYGGLVLTIIPQKDEVVEVIKVNRPGYPLMVMYEKDIVEGF